MGGLVSLYQITNDSQLLTQAEQIATAAMTLLVNDDGILREPCDPRYGSTKNNALFTVYSIVAIRTKCNSKEFL